jgi:hypothetical protein
VDERNCGLPALQSITGEAQLVADVCVGCRIVRNGQDDGVVHVVNLPVLLRLLLLALLLYVVLTSRLVRATSILVAVAACPPFNWNHVRRRTLRALGWLIDGPHPHPYRKGQEQQCKQQLSVLAAMEARKCPNAAASLMFRAHIVGRHTRGLQVDGTPHKGVMGRALASCTCITCDADGAGGMEGGEKPEMAHYGIAS